MQQEKVTPSSEMVSDWISGSMFKEDALVMNSTVILPLMSQYCICHPITKVLIQKIWLSKLSFPRK
jgi:hypothetical protein